MAEYNFNVQDPYAAQAADIARRQKMAEIMQVQALQPIEKFSYNGIEARISPYQGLAKMLQAYMGGRGQAAALEEQKALGEKVRSEQQGQIKDFMSAMTGTPGMPERAAVLDPQEIAQAQDRGAVKGGVSDTGAYQIPAVAEVAPDRQKALALALQSSNPMLQSAGGALLTSILPKTPKWQASTKFNDNGEEIHGFVDINSPQPEDTFRASSTKPAALVEVTTTNAAGQPVKKFVNARTVSEEGIAQPLAGFYGELQQMGVNLNSPQVLSVLNSYVAGKSGNVTAKDAVDFQIKLANLGLASQRAAYEVPGGGAAMPNIPKPFNLFDMNRPSSAATPQSNMPPAMPAQMPNQAPAQMPVQPPVATSAPGSRIAAALNTMPPQTVRIPTTPVAPTVAPSMIGGVDVSKLPPKERNNLLAKQAESAITGKPTQENTLRDEYNSLTAPFRTVQDAYSKITNVANTGAGDMSLLYSYVKMLDPGSVVRESEFATAAASGSFGERVQGAMQRVMSGQRLPDTLRKDFIVEAKNIYTQQNKAAKRLEDQYTGIAQRNGLNPKNVIVNYAAPDEQPKSKPIQFKPNQTIPLPTVQAPTNRIPRYNPETGKIE